jgi:hypothetical protein
MCVDPLRSANLTDSEQILKSLRYITTRLDALFDCVEDVYSFHAASVEIRTACESQQRLASFRSTVVPAAASRSNSGSSDIEELVKLLRSLDIDIDSTNLSEAKTALIDICLTRSARTQSQYAAVEHASTAILNEYLGQQQGESSAALKAVHKYSHFAVPNLASPAITQQLESLQASLDATGNQITELEGPQQQGPSDGLVILKDRWSK